jgi:uncharacterized repeat protein (TIGR04076 family)
LWRQARRPFRTARRDAVDACGQGFSIYSISAVLPLLAAKQRETHPNDWMTSDAEIACPDPNCGSRLRIVRLGKRRFSHAAATAVPLGGAAGA